MKFLVVGNESGGMYRFRIGLIRELLKKHQVTVSVPDGEFIEQMKLVGCKIIITPINRRRMNPLEDLRLFLNYKQIVKKERPEIVVTYTIKPNIYCGFACRLMNVTYVANITGLGSSFQNKGLTKQIVRVLYRIALKKAKVVFFENAENRDIFVRDGILNGEKTHILNGAGVNTQHFALVEYPREKTVRFIFLGRIMMEKGIDELIFAMRKLKDKGFDVELSMVGYCEDTYEEKIREWEKENLVVFHGKQQDVRSFIAESHCCVLPSWHEGMANTNLECASMGRPVITSNIHGCLEAVEPGVTGFLCEKQNANDLFSVMRKFMDLSYDQRREMGLAGRKRMENLFDKKKVVEETISVLINN